VRMVKGNRPPSTVSDFRQMSAPLHAAWCDGHKLQPWRWLDLRVGTEVPTLVVPFLTLS
jgi:hypothetical protein